MSRLALAAAVLFCASHAAAETTLKFGGQLRARGEVRNPESYAAFHGKDEGLLRTRLDVEAALPKSLKAFLQVQDSRSSGGEASVVANEKNTDLHQGYLDVADLYGKPVDLRAGRMELLYGDERLVGNADWLNTARSFDGLRLRTRGGVWTADVFATVTKESGSLRKDEVFSGFYGSCKALPGHDTDAYFLAKTSTGTAAGDVSRYTAGIRLKGSRGAAAYSAEAAFQFGREGGARVKAGALVVTGSYGFDAAYKPRLGLEYAYASGDTDPTDGKNQTFDPLYPSQHPYQGFLDIVALKNVHDFKLGSVFEPAKGWKAYADVHHFRLAQAKDAWYAASGAAIARDAAGSYGKELGHELDLHARTTIRDSLQLWFGYSHFFTSVFANNTKNGRDMDWAFLQATLNF